MKLNFKTSQSSVKPDLVDTTSSKTSVYIRQNITESITTDSDTNEKYTYYTYEEAKLTKTKYQQYLNEKLENDLVNQNETIAELLYEVSLMQLNDKNQN